MAAATALALLALEVTLLAGTELAWLVVIGYFLWRLLT
jgi:hypothetical protein